MGTIKCKPYCIALTGGIASGKTTVANFFAKLGVPIIDADVIAHQLTEKNKSAYHQIIAHFGNTILNHDDTINRKKLQELIFDNPSEKTWLENVLHPLIRAEIKKQLFSITDPYCICVIPLLAETKKMGFVDRVLVIKTSEAMQLERAVNRDQSSKEQIKKILQAQISSHDRCAIADDMLENTSDLGSLEKHVGRLHEQYLGLAGKWRGNNLEHIERF